MVMQIKPIALLLLNTSQISFYFLQRIINVIDTSWEIPASSSWISVYFVDPFSSKNKIFSLKLYVKKKKHNEKRIHLSFLEWLFTLFIRYKHIEV